MGLEIRNRTTVYQREAGPGCQERHLIRFVHGGLFSARTKTRCRVRARRLIRRMINRSSLACHFTEIDTVNSTALCSRFAGRKNVRFLTDWRDDKVKNPTELARRADSLRDTGKTNEAQGIYQTLVDNFALQKRVRRRSSNSRKSGRNSSRTMRPSTTIAAI